MLYPDFLKYQNVPHETFQKLSGYVEILLKWNSRVNLISRSSEVEVWRRHVLDSAQLIEFISPDFNVLDVGSGAGFPGIVLNILGLKISMVDSDQKKCSFLTEVSRVLELKNKIINDRVENIILKDFDVVVSRGLMSIYSLLEGLQLTKDHKILLLKGKSYFVEIQEALQKLNFEYITYPSITDSSARIIEITNVQKA